MIGSEYQAKGFLNIESKTWSEFKSLYESDLLTFLSSSDEKVLIGFILPPES